MARQAMGQTPRSQLDRYDTRHSFQKPGSIEASPHSVTVRCERSGHSEHGSGNPPTVFAVQSAVKEAVIPNGIAASAVILKGAVRCERSGHSEHGKRDRFFCLGVQSAVKEAVIPNMPRGTKEVPMTVQSAVKEAVIRNT